MAQRAEKILRMMGRVYFALTYQHLVRGAAGRVQTLADHQLIASHPRHTPERIVIDPSHYEGPSTDTVQAPMPLGRMGKKLQQLAQLLRVRMGVCS